MQEVCRVLKPGAPLIFIERGINVSQLLFVHFPSSIPVTLLYWDPVKGISVVIQNMQAPVSTQFAARNVIFGA